jgi:hypothetical protein
MELSEGSLIVIVDFLGQIHFTIHDIWVNLKQGV